MNFPPADDNILCEASVLSAGGIPDDIANMVLYLCSDMAGFITGENVCIDGGMTRQMIYHNDYGWSFDRDNEQMLLLKIIYKKHPDGFNSVEVFCYIFVKLVFIVVLLLLL